MLPNDMPGWLIGSRMVLDTGGSSSGIEEKNGRRR
jgi:hypothetical protein